MLHASHINLKGSARHLRNTQSIMLHKVTLRLEHALHTRIITYYSKDFIAYSQVLVEYQTIVMHLDHIKVGPNDGWHLHTFTMDTQPLHSSRFKIAIVVGVAANSQNTM